MFPRKAWGARRVPGAMNKTEASYGQYLEARKSLKEIEWYAFEAMKFRLADKTFYTPDFIVMAAGGELQAHDVKGFWEDDARVKIKVAAETFPIKFVAVQVQAKKDGGGWKYEEF